MRSLAPTPPAQPSSADGTSSRGPLARLLAIVALLLAATLLLAACGDDDDTDVGATDDTADDADGTDDGTDDGADDGADGAVAVETAQTDLGEVLVDSEGFTLYVFTMDDPGVSNCYDDCADNWPPALVEEGFEVGEGLDAGIFGTVERDDGAIQLAVNEMPLYRFTPDEAPGDTNGQGVIDAWYVVAPDGTMIQDAPAEDGDAGDAGDEGGDTDEMSTGPRY